ncbi:MAG: hypothetical protein J6J24_04955 [Clostridia bacterium]|nr:hypothetical protein [Clostridia bacterium]
MTNEKRDKKFILATNTVMQIVFCFFSLFFNIYVYEVAQDFNVVMLYTLTYVLTVWIFFTIIRKFLTQRALKILYRLSFVLCIACTLLTFLITKERLYLVFLIQVLYAITNLFYYMPSEIAAISKNRKSQIKKFNGLNTAVAVFASVLSPILSGFIIDYVSYYVLFAIMSTCAVISFILACQVNITNGEVEHIKLKEFVNEIKKDKSVRYGYIAYGLKRFSQDGPIERILPILLFLRTGFNHSVGLYSALAAFVGTVILLLYVYFCKKTTLALWIVTILQFISSILIIISGSLVCFFIYYFVKHWTTKIITNEATSGVFLLLDHTHLKKYTVEHYYIINTFSNGSLVIACILSLLIYNFLHNVISISIFLALASFCQLISTFLMIKSNNLLKNIAEFDESKQSTDQSNNND